jgi:hypothetical protein
VNLTNFLNQSLIHPLTDSLAHSLIHSFQEADSFVLVTICTSNFSSFNEAVNNSGSIASHCWMIVNNYSERIMEGSGRSLI